MIDGNEVQLAVGYDDGGTYHMVMYRLTSSGAISLAATLSHTTPFEPIDSGWSLGYIYYCGMMYGVPSLICADAQFGSPLWVYQSPDVSTGAFNSLAIDEVRGHVFVTGEGVPVSAAGTSPTALTAAVSRYGFAWWSDLIPIVTLPSTPDPNFDVSTARSVAVIHDATDDDYPLVYITGDLRTGPDGGEQVPYLAFYDSRSIVAVEDSPSQETRVWRALGGGDVIRLLFENPLSGDTTVRVFDARGRLVRDLEASAMSTEFQIAGLGSGVFFVQVDGLGTAAQRALVVH